MTKLLLWCCTAVAAFGATTTTWEMSSYQDFIKGRFNGVSLDRDGRLTLAPKLDTLLTSGQAVVWTMVQAADGSLYIGTGHRGRIYRVAPGGASTLVWTADQPEVFALALDSAGVLYAATSPDGKVYRIENGKAAEFFAPKAKYIWGLAFGKDGMLYVAAGDPGDVYAVDKSGKGELYYSTGQAHVTSLAIDAQGRLLAGSEPNGILYRISAKDKAFVLYDANLPEIRSIKPMPDGTVYAAALGGALASSASGLTPISLGTTSVTVTAPATSISVSENAQAGADVKPKPADTPKSATPAPAATNLAASVELPGVDKAAIYKINPDNTVETIWSSKEENIYDLAMRPDGNILFSTDVQARIYSLGADHKPTLLVQTNEGEATRLLETASGVLASTGDAGKVFRLAPAADQTPVATGSYQSPVHDANTVARWGRLTWRQHNGTASFQTRTGNSSRPDQTWSEWSAPIRDPQGSLIQSPNARYIQWRAELSGTKPVVEDVVIAYLPQNTPPVVRSITVSSAAASGATTPKSASTANTAAYTITVTDSGDAQTAATGTPTQALSRAQGSQIQVTWQADDPDGDKLAYALWFRGEEEQQWKLVRTNLFDNSFLIDGDVLADGRYYFRIVATDRPSNPVNLAREAELVSTPVLIDNTPPVVTLSEARRNATHVEVDVDAADKTSPLRRCEYSLDAGPWMPLEAADGVTDSPREQFHIALENVRAGEHLIVVRVYDTAGNAGLAKVVVR
ncbi:MAG TPA: hypothetical protein VKU01_29530 [Bryobacteraceae bacterium]|nr:hypothetical protein [Bryobacteraceae bacterium]